MQFIVKVQVRRDNINKKKKKEAITAIGKDKLVNHICSPISLQFLTLTFFVVSGQ